MHQHFWSEQLVEALSERRRPPLIRQERDLRVLHVRGEQPYLLQLEGESAAARRELLRRDGVDAAVVCLSSALGIEGLPRREAATLLAAYHEGALALGEPFAVWGAVPTVEPTQSDVDDVLARGCIGVSLPAGALSSLAGVLALAPLLRRLDELAVPLFVHPGPCAACPSLTDPLWWPAMNAYVAQMQAAWLAFVAAGRPLAPRLAVVFAMLAGLAPLHAERLRSRGGPPVRPRDPLLFYETSSYGPAALAMMGSTVGRGQILYGSDRPVVDPAEVSMPGSIDWSQAGAAAERALGATPVPA